MGAGGGGHVLDNGVHLLLGEITVLQPGSIRLINLGADLLYGQEVFSSNISRIFFETTRGDDLLHFLVRTRNDVHRDQFADPAGGGGAGIRRGLDRADIAADHHAHQARAYILLAGEHHVGGFHHGVGGFNGAHQTLRFNQAQGLHASSKFSV